MATKAIILNDAFSVIRAKLEMEPTGFNISNFVTGEIYSPNLPIWIFDGPGNKATRQNIYPEYKANRKPAKEDIYRGLQFIKDVMKVAGLTVIEVPGYEADDIIADLVNRFRGIMPIQIRTRDYDLRALCSKEDNIHCTVDPKPGVPDHLIQLWKLWTGDPSDNIPGVNRFGPKAWDSADLDDIIAVTAAAIQNKPIPRVETVSETHLVWIEQNRDRWMAMKHCLNFQPVPRELIDQHTTKNPPDLMGWKKLVEEFA